MKTLLVFDNDGVLRDESVSYQRCIAETVAFFSGSPATEKELVESMKVTNNDWKRTQLILENRRIRIDLEKITAHFQDLYLGKDRNFTGYINLEPWLADNSLLEELSRKHTLVIVSGAPKPEVEYTLRRNNALHYFSAVLGMDECENKMQGIQVLSKRFGPERVMFCDDRPSPIREVSSMPGNVSAYGILPPNPPADWESVLREAGARAVFKNVREYCGFLSQLSN